MILLKLPSRKRARDEAEKPFWISYSDLMTALMVLFLVSVTVALFAVTKKQDETAIKQSQREREIQELLNKIAKSAKDYPGIVVEGNSIDFGSQANFATDSSTLSPKQEATLRAFVPKILSVARDPLGKKWLKRIVVDGFADQRGSYMYNLNLSLQRSERVLCVLLASQKTAPGALSEADRLLTRELFLVGGSSFNDLKASLDESRRIELKLEFLELGETRTPPREAPLDDGACPLH